MPICPICARPAGTRTQNKAFPFCSSRCRQVDLGRWLDEKYRISIPGSDQADSDGADPTDPADSDGAARADKDAPFGKPGRGVEAPLNEAGEDHE